MDSQAPPGLLPAPQPFLLASHELACALRFCRLVVPPLSEPVKCPCLLTTKDGPLGRATPSKQMLGRAGAEGGGAHFAGVPVGEAAVEQGESRGRSLHRLHSTLFCLNSMRSAAPLGLDTPVSEGIIIFFSLSLFFRGGGRGGR